MRNRKHDIEKYLRGELSAAEMHALEKEALNDPFLAEALEGVEQAGADNFLFDLHRLNRSVHDRSRRNRKTKTIKMWGWTAGIAATVLLLAVSGFLVVCLLKDQRARELSMQEQIAPAEDTKPTQDSLTVGSGEQPSALKDETGEITAQEETRARTELPSPQKPRTSTGQVRVKESASETPKNDDVPTSEGFLALENKAKDEETIAEADKQPDPIIIADAQEPDAKEREDADAAKDNGDAGQKIADDAKDQELAKKIRGRAAGLETPSTATTRAVPADPLVIKGKVVSAEDGDVLPGVNVTIKGTNIGTMTDGEGHYELAVPPDNATLLFSFIGFTSKELQVTDQPELNVELAEDVTSLSEVIVTGYGGSNNTRTEAATFYSAEPERGKSDFKNYLEEEVKYPEEAVKNKAEGRVTIQFTVEPNGQLSEFQVLKGIGHGCDQELIRAIRQGPAWKPSKQGDRPVRGKVKVRYKFELPK